MKLYHGSRYILKDNKLVNKKATSGGFDDVPKEKLQDGIYLTPDYGFAVAMAVRPNGGTRINNNKISFEHQELFNSDQDVFVYVFDTEDEQFKNKEIEYHNKNEYMVRGDSELVPSEIKNIKAREVLKYYEIVKWNEINEIKQEQKIKFK